jgi:hypothetical protein
METVIPTNDFVFADMSVATQNPAAAWKDSSIQRHVEALILTIVLWLQGDKKLTVVTQHDSIARFG